MTVNDDKWKFLRDTLDRTDTINDMYYAYLRGLGYNINTNNMLLLSTDEGDYLVGDNDEPVESY